MDLARYENRYVRIKTIYGDILEGLAGYGDREYLESEWGGGEEGLFIEDFLIYASQIESIEEIEVHGTAELWTEQLTLRRYRREDARELADMTGTGLYQNPEKARETVRRIIGSYADEHFYAWIMDYEDVGIGTIGAWNYDDDSIEAGFTVTERWRGRGLETEALAKVLEYLTENECIPCVTAGCAPDDALTRQAYEEAGMKRVPAADGRAVFEYRILP